MKRISILRVNGGIVDFNLSRQRDEKSARAFLRKKIGDNGLPHRIVIDKVVKML